MVERMVGSTSNFSNVHEVVDDNIALTAGELEEGSREAKIEKIKQAKNSVNSDYVNAHMEALDGHKALALL
ncbi:hypothetical protein NC653_039109 [Populus alba x Populus x berolinensis]|uniref:Uncharacterized protein n=1 Tax=Populus alba x Populus x berolinensis TaxID=444605 RepID=A0AAD6LAP5_9ROSI|nr:hypothetical protein NC653_039109 [Populus alba x Populus x berolinensis]